MAFFSEQLLEPHDVQINVDGVGRLAFPLSGDVMAQLLRLTKPASYGRGKKTVLDATVRDTGEIAAEYLDVRFTDGALQRAMRVLAEHLELEADALEAPKLHNLLLYEKGQFFKPHQDTEKTPGMVATWVLVLPYPHIGGHLNVTHGQKTHRMRSENVNETRIRCLGFYADCEHEVRPVEDGSRLALTFMISLKPQSAHLLAPDRSVAVNKPLLNQVRQHFEQGDAAPTLFVHYLDHQYTQRGLGWGKLKGVDRQLAQDFAAVARELNLVTHLALAEIQQTWTCWDEDDEPQELIDEGVSLDYWLDGEGNERPYGSQHASSHALHWRTETGADHLERSEYEGYMGNAGNTMDYWYRRAAIVLWRSSDQAAFEFKFDPAGAWQRITKLIRRAGHETEVAQYITSARTALWSGGSSGMAEHLQVALKTAAYIGQAEVAQAMLHNVELDMLDARCAKGLAQLEQRYGRDWLRTRLEDWSAHTEKRFHWRSPQSPPLDELVLAAKGVSLDEGIVLALARHHVASLIDLDQQHAKNTPYQMQTDAPARIKRLQHVLGGLCEMQSADLGQSLSCHVLSHMPLYPLLPIVDMVLALTATRTALPAVAGELLRGLNELLRDRVALPPRAADDWSLQLTSNCSCLLCGTTLAFASSRGERQKIWPLAQQGREHVMQQGREQVWPLEFTVLKQGSPHKLVISKPKRLHEAQIREANEMQARLNEINLLANFGK
jgi:2OG-Fe(II) oxygenase superfamily